MAALDPANVGSRADLVAFIEELAGIIETDIDSAENPTLERYLDAAGRWVADLDGVMQNRGEGVPESPTWSLVASLLYASLYYE